MNQTEVCLCGHDFWSHVIGGCQGDFGACDCEEFIWLGEEEDDDGEA